MVEVVGSKYYNAIYPYFPPFTRLSQIFSAYAVL